MTGTECVDCAVVFGEDESPSDARCIDCFARWLDHNPDQLALDILGVIR